MADPIDTTTQAQLDQAFEAAVISQFTNVMQQSLGKIKEAIQENEQ
jgi:hypothetical protein